MFSSLIVNGLGVPHGARSALSEVRLWLLPHRVSFELRIGFVWI